MAVARPMMLADFTIQLVQRLEDMTGDLSAGGRETDMRAAWGRAGSTRRSQVPL
jgi:hypothetical protein